MFATARKAAKDLISISKANTDEILTIPTQCLPKKYSLSQLYDQLAVADETKTKEVRPISQDELGSLLILSTCLSEPSRLSRKSGDEESITQLSLWISKAILPDGNLVPNDEAPDDSSSASRQHALLLAQRKGHLGLQSLNLILPLHSSPPLKIDNQILLSALAFSSSQDSYANPSTVQISTQLLSNYESQIHTPDFIVTYLLQTIIRPLFSKSRPSAVTESGRRAMPSSAPPKRVDFAAERGQKPWKYTAPYSLPILSWAVSAASDEIIKESWHLFVPPVLTLLDDPLTPIRHRGLTILSIFLPKLNAKLLSQTGLDSVFEDAITPTLLYLPNLTPLNESILLLPAAYTALFRLCDVRFAPSPPTALKSPNLNTASNSKEKETEKIEEATKSRLKFLDRILRHGVFQGYAYTSSHPTIVEILVTQLSLLIPRMSIHTVKHLKDIIPILSAVISDPFSSSRPSLLLCALKTLQVMILNTWPRMRESGHRIEIIRALVVCWKTVCEEEGEEKEGEELGKVKNEIGIAGRLLISAVEGEIDMRGELGPIIEVNGELVESVFGITASENE